jgi:hypothetical protein
MVKINIAEEFSENPGLRHCSVSDESGEEFYHKILNNSFYEAITKNQKLTLDLDGGSGYAPSFLDEAIGNLIFDFGLEKVSNSLIIISNDEPEWIDYLQQETYKQWENRRINGEEPKKTTTHQPWYRLRGDRIEKAIW